MSLVIDWVHPESIEVGDHVWHRSWSWEVVDVRRTPYDNGWNLYLEQQSRLGSTTLTYWDDEEAKIGRVVDG